MVVSQNNINQQALILHIAQSHLLHLPYTGHLIEKIRSPLQNVCFSKSNLHTSLNPAHCAWIRFHLQEVWHGLDKHVFLILLTKDGAEHHGLTSLLTPPQWRDRQYGWHRWYVPLDQYFADDYSGYCFSKNYVWWGQMEKLVISELLMKGISSARFLQLDLRSCFWSLSRLWDM